MPTFYDYEKEADEIDEINILRKRKTYQRLCKRCDKIYYALLKGSSFCPKCYKGNIFKKIFGKLNNEEKINNGLIKNGKQ